MSKRLHSITVRGHQHEWSFETYVDPAYLSDWREDGIEIVAIENRIPAWVVGIGLTRIWCFLQDCFHLRNRS